MPAMRDSVTVDKFRRFFQGNEDAVNLALMVIHIADVWDDLIDRDSEVKAEDLNKAFLFATCAMPRNRFYRQHIEELLPVLELGVVNWLTANRFEAAGDRKSLEIANVIRHGIGDLFIHMARLIGGMQWGIEVAPEVKLLVQNDTLEEYLEK
jgi:hypothetical protein